MWLKITGGRGCSNGGKYAALVLTLDVAEADRELRELRHLFQDLLGHQVHASVLRPQIQLPLKPRGSNLNSSVRGHV